MLSNDSRWAELTSQNERVIQLGELGSGSADHASVTARSRWAELASQRERLVDMSDPLFWLASPRHGVSASTVSASSASGMRLVAGAA
jgi:hypothetical protein